MKNKICVYAICKNESQFVDKWLKSMNEADYIVVLDTMSTDDTYEKLKKDKRVTKVSQEVIDPWRFDTARNIALNMCPKDTTIFVSTDLDEIFEPGWADILRDNWLPDYHVRALYKYAWSHNESGEPQRIFYYDKIHGPNWKWKAPVHEYLASDIYKDQSYIDSHSLDLFNMGVYLHHYPDKNKSRKSYLPLLELRAEEDPDDYYGLYYYAHELYYRGYYEKSIAILDKILRSNKFANRRTLLETAACYLFMGDSYNQLDKHELAIDSYRKAIFVDNTYREPYLEMAQVYQNLGCYDVSIGIVHEAIRKSVRHYNWLERDSSWREQPYDILAVSYYYIGQYDKSYINATKALILNSTNERLKDNEKLIKDKLMESPTITS